MSKLEVAAKDGIVRIPKSVFESAPAEVSSSSDVVAKVRRLDGSVDELKRVTPDNPNFQPRKPTPGKVKAVNKDEALIAFYTRKVRARAPSLTFATQSPYPPSPAAGHAAS